MTSIVKSSIQILRQFEDDIKRIDLIIETAHQFGKQKSPDTKLKSGQYSYWINGIKTTKHL